MAPDIAMFRRFMLCSVTLVTAFCACGDAASPRANRAMQAGSPSSQPTPTEAISPSYPTGRWRLVPFDRLSNVVLWISHIVIAHKQSNFAIFRPPGWNPDRVPNRERGEALRLAQRVGMQLASDPKQFAALARLHSDDVVTRTTGGYLPGVRASSLPREYLDAIEAIGPNAVSSVFESPLGFTVLVRHPPPPDEEVTGRRVVIQYEGTIGAPVGRLPTRTREQARSIATEFARKARTKVIPFSDLIKESEHADRTIGGYMGAWSTLHPYTNGRELVALARLRLNETSDLVETDQGFQILQRVRPRAQLELGIEAVRIKVNGGAGASQDALQAAVKQASDALAQWRSGTSVKELQSRYCCSDLPNEAWSAGHGRAELTRAVTPLRIGEWAPKPVALPEFVVVLRRIDPAEVPPQPRQEFELPNPDAVDLRLLFERNPGPLLANQIERLADLLSAFTPLGTDDRRQATATMRILAASLERSSSPEENVSAYDSAERELRRMLSPRAYEILRAAVDHWAAETLMTGSPASSLSSP